MNSLLFASLCFVPGMGGVTDAVRDNGTIPDALAERQTNVQFTTLDTGRKGSVQHRAERLVAEIERKLNDDANFKCHFVAHSLGGVVSRYALAHLKVHHPTRGLIPLSEVAQSLTTIGTPHRGTPLGKLASIFAPWNKAIGQMSRAGTRRFNEAKYKKSYSPRPAEFPLYSYRLTPDGKLKCGRFNERWQLRMSRLLFPKQLMLGDSDSISSKESQGAGQSLGDLKFCHSYFDHDYDLSPSPDEFYEMHAYRLEGKLDAYKERHPATWAKFREMGVLEDPVELGDPAAAPIAPTSHE